MSLFVALVTILGAIGLIVLVEGRLRPGPPKPAASPPGTPLLPALAADLKLTADPAGPERYATEVAGFALELVPREQAWRAAQPIAAVFTLSPLPEALSIAARDRTATVARAPGAPPEPTTGGTGDPDIDDHLQLPVSVASLPLLLDPDVRAAVKDLSRFASWRLDQGRLRFWLEPTVDACRDAIARAVALAQVLSAASARPTDHVFVGVIHGRGSPLSRALALLAMSDPSVVLPNLRSQREGLPALLGVVVDAWSPPHPEENTADVLGTSMLPESAWVRVWEGLPAGLWGPYLARLARVQAERGSPPIALAATRAAIARDPSPTWLRRWLLDAPEATATACLGHAEWLARPDLTRLSAIALARPALTVPTATLLAATANADGIEWLQDAMDMSRGPIARLAIEEAIERIKARLGHAGAS